MVSEDELINTTKKNIEIQLMQVRDNKHKSFLNAKGNEQMCKNGTSDGVENNSNNNSTNNNSNNMNSNWPQNTILITGDSILNNITRTSIVKEFYHKGKGISWSQHTRHV